LQPQKLPNFPFLIVISTLQLGHSGAFTLCRACIEQTDAPWALSFDAGFPQVAQFIQSLKRLVYLFVIRGFCND